MEIATKERNNPIAQVQKGAYNATPCMLLFSPVELRRLRDLSNFVSERACAVDNIGHVAAERDMW